MHIYTQVQYTIQLLIVPDLQNLFLELCGFIQIKKNILNILISNVSLHWNREPFLCMSIDNSLFPSTDVLLNTIEQIFHFIEQLDQLEVCLPYSRLLTGIPILVVFQNLRWNSNKTSLLQNLSSNFCGSLFIIITRFYLI